MGRKGAEYEGKVFIRGDGLHLPPPIWQKLSARRCVNLQVACPVARSIGKHHPLSVFRDSVLTRVSKNVALVILPCVNFQVAYPVAGMKVVPHRMLSLIPFGRMSCVQC